MRLNSMNIRLRTFHALIKLGFCTAGEVINAAMANYIFHYNINRFSLRTGLLRLPGIGKAAADDFICGLEMILPNAGLDRPAASAGTVGGVVGGKDER